MHGDVKMKEAVLGIGRIRHNYPMLSVAEKRIADYIMKNPAGLENQTVVGLAEATGTSPATIIRFCRSIGFKGFIDFKQYLKNDHNHNAAWLRVNFKESIAMIKEKTFGYNRTSVNEMLAILDDDYLEQAVALIDGATSIAMVAEGGSGSSARAAYDAFLQIGLPAVLLDDPIFQVLSVGRLAKDSVVLLFNHSGQSRNIIDVAKLAKKMDLPTIGLVGVVGSPLMKYIDIPLLTGMSDHPFFSDSLAARICELYVVSTIHGIITMRRKDNLVNNLQEVSDLLSLKREKR